MTEADHQDIKENGIYFLLRTCAASHIKEEVAGRVFKRLRLLEKIRGAFTRGSQSSLQHDELELRMHMKLLVFGNKSDRCLMNTSNNITI